MSPAETPSCPKDEAMTATLISRYEISGGKIHITTPYSDGIAGQCRSWAGKFSGGAWHVADTRLPAVQKMLGADLDDLVEVEVQAGDWKDDGAQIRVGWYVLAGRRGRDYRADVHADLVAGSIPSHGGSMKYPSVNETNDARFRLWVPRDFAASRNLVIVTDPRAEEPSAETPAEPAPSVQPYPPIAVLADALRGAIAGRRDRLEGLQRQHHDASRQAEIDLLRGDYDRVYALALRAGIDVLPADDIATAAGHLSDSFKVTAGRSTL
jgi:hypothetical protein